MKKWNLFSFALCVLLLVGCSDKGIVATSGEEQEVATRSTTEESYFPVKPGSAEWSSFTTHSQMVEACQLSEELLQSLTTDELVRVCAEYPLNMDAYAYSNVHDGMRVVTGLFNGYQELFNRTDNAACLLSYLQENNLNEVFSSTAQARSSLEIGKSILQYNLMESLFSFDEIIQNMDKMVLKETAAFLKQQLELKEANPQYVGGSSLNVSVVSLGKTILKASNGLDKQIEQIILNRGVQNETELQLLKNKSLGIIK